MRDEVVDFVRRWSEKAEIGAGRFIRWLGVTASKFYDWRERYGRVNEHNGWIPEISGWSRGRKKPSFTITSRIHGKVIGDLHT